MIFDSTISIADIISILGLTLSFITIIFLFIQRKDSSRIYISIKDKKNSHIFKNNKIIEESLYMKLLGNNIARNINLKIDLVSDNIKLSNYWYESNAKDALVYVKNKCFFDNISLDEMINITQSFYGALYSMLDDILTLVPSFKHKDCINLNKNYILIKMTYEDIHSYKYCQYYKIFILVNSIDFFNNSFNYSINIEEVSKKDYKKIIKNKSSYNENSF